MKSRRATLRRARAVRPLPFPRPRLNPQVLLRRPTRAKGGAMEETRFRAMGSDVHVVVVGDHRLLDMARTRIDDLEQRWSRFIPGSEIDRLNAKRGTPVDVSDETFLLVRRALEGWRATGGRFDPT